MTFAKKILIGTGLGLAGLASFAIQATAVLDPMYPVLSVTGGDLVLAVNCIIIGKATQDQIEHITQGRYLAQKVSKNDACETVTFAPRPGQTGMIVTLQLADLQVPEGHSGWQQIDSLPENAGTYCLPGADENKPRKKGGGARGFGPPAACKKLK